MRFTKLLNLGDYSAILPLKHTESRGNFSIFTVTADTRGSFSCSSVWFCGRKQLNSYESRINNGKPRLYKNAWEIEVLAFGFSIAFTKLNNNVNLTPMPGWGSLKMNKNRCYNHFTPNGVDSICGFARKVIQIFFWRLCAFAGMTAKGVFQQPANATTLSLGLAKESRGCHSRWIFFSAVEIALQRYCIGMIRHNLPIFLLNAIHKKF